MTEHHHTIHVDTREPFKENDKLFEHLLHKGFLGMRKYMETGDYGWTTKDGREVLIERKATSDLAHTIVTPRWADQMNRLQASADVPILLVQGTWPYESPKAKGLTSGGLDSHLITLQEAGIYVAHCDFGHLALATRLMELYFYTGKQDHTSLVPRTDGRGKVEVRKFLGFLQGLPGCGPRTAAKVVDCITKKGVSMGLVDLVLALTVPVDEGNMFRGIVPEATLVKWKKHLTDYHKFGEVDESCVSMPSQTQAA